MSNTSPTIKAIIFDHDGTLVDSEPVHHGIWQDTLAPYEVSISMDTYKTHLSGTPTIHSANWIVQSHQLPVEAAHLCDIKLKAIEAFLTQDGFPLMPGVKELLAWLSRSEFKLGVASGAALSEVEHSLNFHNITEHFEAVATKNHVTNNKPAPDVYLHAAKSLGVAPEHCLAIEDSDNGQQSAIAAQMHCLRLDTYSALAPHARCHKIQALAEVRPWLEGTVIL